GGTGRWWRFPGCPSECRASASRLASVDGVRIVGARVDHLPFAVFQMAEEAALVPFVANAGTERLHLYEHGVAVAIGRDLFYDEAVARAFPLEPELLAGAAIKSRIAGLDRFSERLLVHIPVHQDTPGGGVLNDRG